MATHLRDAPDDVRPVLQAAIDAGEVIPWYRARAFQDLTLRLMLQLIAGLEHVHSNGVQHRDLKPANILLSAGGTALIGDFGIAKPMRS